MTQPDGARPDLVLEGHIAPDHERRYLSVPFAVPPGVGQLTVSYDYSDRIASDPDLAGGSTLDIGLFDERGDEAGGPGFRGWSGSARRQFTVGERWATPPYRPGPTRAGQWSVLLGPYKVPPRGTDYRVEITFSDEHSAELPAEAAAPPLAALPARTIATPAEPGWVRADLHSHTVFSDGDSWPAETIAAAWAAGLDVVGITDHNSAISAADYADGLASGPLLVPGVEMTTYGGHWNAWAAPGVTGHRWYDFREPDQASTERAMAAAVADGALVSINHPKPLGPMWEYPGVRSFHAVEVWNGAWPKLNAAALAYWETLLRAGHRVTAIGGSDTHRLRDSRRPRFGFPEARFGQPTTFLRTGDGPPTISAVHAAIRRGDVFITESPDGPELYVRRDPEDEVVIHVVGAGGDTLSVIGPDGAVHAAAIPAANWTMSIPWPDGCPWLRVQISDRLGQMRTLSNAVWR